MYLKPKKNQANSDANNSATQNSNDNTADIAATANNTIDVDATKAYEDDSVIQSDLKTIKQSAVKMSVGQKQEASQILKDWLADGKTDDTDNNGTDEESN